MSDLSPDLLEFVKLLVANKVKFIVVGGVALAYHGVIRYTGDIDFLVDCSTENSERVESTIREFGFSSLGLIAKDFEDPDLIVQLGHEPNRIDLITQIDGVSFVDAWESRITAELGGVPVAMLSRRHLLANKLASGRAKDMLDVKELNKLARETAGE